jgi:hypothetical protein
MKHRWSMKTAKGRGVVCVGGFLEGFSVEEEAPQKNKQNTHCLLGIHKSEK